MKWVKYTLTPALVAGLITSLIFVAYIVAYERSIPGWELVASELLLVFVLAAEGLLAFFHLREARDSAQAEALRDFMHAFCSDEALIDRERLYTELRWGKGFGDIPTDFVKWNVATEGDSITYRMAGNENCAIQVTMKSKIWASVQRMGDQYHFAGLCCERGSMATEDVLKWMGPQALRWWRRLGDIILQERHRRGHPGLFSGFEMLANLTEKFFRERYPGLTKI
jgi:hypothetical protein